MTSTSYRPSNFSQPPRDPSVAAMLSIIPGLGQLYNGQTRKGFLFLGVSAINFLIFLVVIFTDPILATLLSMGQSFHVKPNHLLVEVVSQAHFGSAVSIMFIGLVLSFISFAVRDAYDHAATIQRKHIYPEYVMEMPEATSGSYIMHFTMMMTCFILAFFFLVPPPPKTQVTDIEFIQDQPITKKKIRSIRKATHASESSGQHRKEPLEAPSPAPKAASKANAPSAKPSPAKPAEHQTPSPKPAQPSPTPTPR
ncbi:MAG: hypothetical protein K2X29_01545, partial [Candidatus Obscuribacterales bacterium]|nr:hypothetical protein [Candidatus Obscuribacterales bacterium]